MSAEQPVNDTKQVTVTINMPPVNVNCPHCEHNDTHYNIFDNDNGHLHAVTSCDECNGWFVIEVDV